MRRVVVNSPCTYYIRFSEEMPRLFMLDRCDGRGYYFRYLDGKTPRIKFNIPDIGCYETNVPVEVTKVVRIEIPNNLPILPPPERDKWKPVTIRKNASISSPARIFTDTGLIEVNDRFEQLIEPIQKFLIWHEKGHFFYETEEKCDLFALVNFLRAGYNQSTAYHTMRHILKRSNLNIDRTKKLFTEITKISGL